MTCITIPIYSKSETAQSTANSHRFPYTGVLVGATGSHNVSRALDCPTHVCHQGRPYVTRTCQSIQLHLRLQLLQCEWARHLTPAQVFYWSLGPVENLLAQGPALYLQTRRASESCCSATVGPQERLCVTWIVLADQLTHWT